jgi:hypothetical protein
MGMELRDSSAKASQVSTHVVTSLPVKSECERMRSKRTLGMLLLHVRVSDAGQHSSHSSETEAAAHPW